MYIPLLGYATADPQEYLVNTPLPEQQFSTDCKNSLIGGTNFSSNTVSNAYSYEINDIAYTEEESAFDDNIGISIGSGFVSSYENGDFHPKTGVNNYEADVYTIVSNPRVLREEYIRKEDNVNRLIFALYDNIYDTVLPNGKLLFLYTVTGIEPGSEVRFVMDVEDVYPDGPTLEGDVFKNMLQLRVNANSGNMVSEQFPNLYNNAEQTLDYTYTAASSNITFSVYARNWPAARPLSFSNIKVYGCLQKAIFTSTGESFGYEGSVTTIVATGFEGYDGNYKWERSSDGINWELVVGATTADIEIDLELGSNYFRCSRGGQSVEAEILGVINCSENVGQNEIFKETFGTTKGRTNNAVVDACDTYVYKPLEEGDGKVDDGRYCVVSNLLQASPRLCDWPGGDGSKTDHTGDPDGAFLVINAGNLVNLFYECELGSTLCADTWYNMSLYAANIARSPNEPAEFRFKVVAKNTGNVLEEWYTGPIQGMSEDGIPLKWHRYGFSFMPLENTDIIIRIYSTSDAMQGNDFAVDDIVVTTCLPDVKLYADYSNGNIDFVGSCSEPIILDAVSVGDVTNIFPNPYYLWQQSLDDGETWQIVAQGANMSNIEESLRGGSKSLYKVILAENRSVAEIVASGGTVPECSSYVLSNIATVICEGCKVLPQIDIKVSDNHYCVDALGSISLTASIFNEAEVFFYKWEKYNDYTGDWELLQNTYSSNRSNTIVIDPRPIEDSQFRVCAGTGECFDYEYVNITVKPLAGADFVSALGDEVCPGETAHLVATSYRDDVVQYTWYADENLAHEIATGQALDIFDVSVPGAYYVTVQGEDFCETPIGDASVAFVTLKPVITSAIVQADYEKNENGSLSIGNHVDLSLLVEPSGITYNNEWYSNGLSVALSNSDRYVDTPYVDTRYSIVVNDMCGTVLNPSVNVVVDWPTLITPHNPDAKNDDFLCGLDVEIKLKIYDRFGNLVYSGNNGWPRSEAAQNMPGVYYYIATLPDGSIKKGTVEIYK